MTSNGELFAGGIGLFVTFLVFLFVIYLSFVLVKAILKALVKIGFFLVYRALPARKQAAFYTKFFRWIV